MTTNVITLDPANKVVSAVVTQIRSDMRAAGRYSAYVAEFNVTKENVKDHAAALARLVTPETAQTKDGARTKYGNAVQAAGNGLRAALGKEDAADKPATLRITLSGEGGGSAVVPADHPFYSDLIALIGA